MTMRCDEAGLALMEGLEQGEKRDCVAQHLEVCTSCAAEFAADREVWSSLSAYAAPRLGDEAGARISARLSAAAAQGRSSGSTRASSVPKAEGFAWGLGSWAVVTAAVLLGLGVGGWMGMGAKEMLGGSEAGAGLPAEHQGLLEIADSVFDVAPPGSPASAWLVASARGER